MIQKPLASSGTTEFSSPENDDDENQISDGEPKEENGSGKKASVTPPAASEEGTITTKSKDWETFWSGRRISMSDSRWQIVKQ